MKPHVLAHSLGKVFLSILRDKNTPQSGFRPAAHSLTSLLIAEAAKNLPIIERQIVTPLETTTGFFIEQPVFVPILRAGLGMLESALDLFPNASVGMIGVQRNEDTAIASKYYSKIPTLTGKTVFILEPMLATGGTSGIVLDEITKGNPAKIYFISVVAAPEGISALSRFENVELFVASIDRELNNKKYILPGLGDFGDRLFGTI